jgi:hypothetical protein
VVTGTDGWMDGWTDGWMDIDSFIFLLDECTTDVKTILVCLSISPCTGTKDCSTKLRTALSYMTERLTHSLITFSLYSRY